MISIYYAIRKVADRPVLRHMLFRWGLGLIYILLCLGLILLLPYWLQPIVLVAYLIHSARVFWHQESSVGLDPEARPLTRWDVPDYDRFREQLSQACQELGLKREPIWVVIEDDEPEAFAVGGRRGVVAFTTALLRIHPPEELLAIAGHEIKHLAARDSLPALLGGSWLALLGWTSAYLRNLEVGGLIGVIAVLIAFAIHVVLTVVGWVAHVVLARRSRHEEHEADLAGARVTSATAMITALERLESVIQSKGKGSRREPARWSPTWITQELHASHPKTEARVAFLRMAAERGEVSV